MQHGVTFDSMVVDCEGCFEKMLADFPKFIARQKRVVLEADYGKGWQTGGHVDYTQVVEKMRQLDFNLAYSKRVCCGDGTSNIIPLIVFVKKQITV